jgi:ABC-type sugar transport system permease subunit
MAFRLRGARHLLALLTYLPVATAVLLSLVVTRQAVLDGFDRLLQAETRIAAELLRDTQDPAALSRLFQNRWRLVSPNLNPTIDEAVVLEGPEGPTGWAAVYDEEQWFTVGLVRVSPPPERTVVFPFYILAVTGISLVLLVPLAVEWIRAVTRRRRTPFTLVAPVAALVLATVPVALAGHWTTTRLASITDQRMRVASLALEEVQDFPTMIERPGDIVRLTRLSYVLFSGDGTVEFSTLPNAPTDDLARIARPAPGRVVADGVTYAAADVGRVRLIMVPHEQTEGPVTWLFVIVSLGVLLPLLPVSLAQFTNRPRTLRRNAIAWSFMAPSLLHLAVFTFGPLAFAAWLSLHRWSLVDVARPFVGLENYARLLGDGEFWNAVKNTAVFTLHVPVSMVVALSLALLVHRRVRGATALRAMLFLPSITSLVAIAVVWQWMLNDEFGLINWALSRFGVGPVPWLTSPTTALPAIMIMSIWLVVGYQMVLFQAGLNAIPQDHYDAAKIDGAGRWQRFIHVTLPGLRHTLFFVLITSVIGSFQVFGAVYVMTEGGPLRSTDVAVYHIYQEAWEFLRFGDAAAMSWVLFLIIFVATWLQFRTLERRGEEASA